MVRIPATPSSELACARPGVQVEGRAGDQDVEAESEHADRLPFVTASIDECVSVGRVDDGDAAAADHLDGLVGTDERGGVLVEADADRERVVRERSQQAAEPVALRGSAGR